RAWTRGISLILGVVALMVLVFGSGVTGFLPIGVPAVLLWAAGSFADHFSAAGAYLPYDAVTAIDEVGQRIEGLTGSGALASLRIPDLTDFWMVVSLATGQSAASAA